jgi:hypothetical protein
MKNYIISFTLLLTLCACEKKSEPAKMQIVDAIMALPSTAD